MSVKGTIKKSIAMLIVMMMTTGIFIVGAASPVEPERLPIRAIFEEEGAVVEWHDANRTIHIELMGNVYVLHTSEPVSYVNNVAVPLQDGIVLLEGRAFITQNDLAVLMQAVVDGIESTIEPMILIITGRYGQGTPEENERVASILGGENSQERFNVYFNWYNTVHEIGHVVDRFSWDSEFDFFEGELFANEFAVAFWAHYGDEETFDLLREVVSHAIENIDSPLAEGEDLYDFARLWVAGELAFDMETYGWFQFNLAYRVLNEMRDLTSVLSDVGIDTSEAPPQRTLALSSLEEESIPEILVAVFTALRDDWGINVPINVYFMPSDEPHVHAAVNLVPEVIRNLKAQFGLKSETTVTELLEAFLPSAGLGEAGEITRVWSVD